MAALVEGLAGITEQGVAFSRVRISPRWLAAGRDTAWVTVRYAASEGYVSYFFRHFPEKHLIQLTIAGSGETATVHVLLPDTVETVHSVKSGGVSLPFYPVSIGKSKYIDFELPLKKVSSCEIIY
jgi:hypothetical protein